MSTRPPVVLRAAGRVFEVPSVGHGGRAVVLWTTRYIDAAVAQLQVKGHEIRGRTSPGSPRSSTAT
ncbi:hypothetical protein ACFYXM_31395 [Streptomyces sp. NPDC002476]|uniref:hypothetical protein n=1 Tax=Streptomyces sp. NPDC002476 TaxID=3364648 RepID=UPI0036A0CA0D